MTEKELQKLFQKKFADREIPYNPDAWSSLEKMLDKAATPWYARKSFYYQSSAVVASVAIAAGVYFNWPYEPQVEELIPVTLEEKNENPVPITDEFSSERNIDFEDAASSNDEISEESSTSSLTPATTAKESKSAESQSVQQVETTSADEHALADEENLELEETLAVQEEFEDFNTEVNSSETMDSDFQAEEISTADLPVQESVSAAALTSATARESSNQSENPQETVQNDDGIASKTDAPDNIEIEEIEQTLISEEELIEPFHVSVLDPINPEDFELKLLDVDLDEPDYVEPLVGPKNKGLRSDFSWNAFAMFGFGNQLTTDENSSGGLASFGLGTGIKWTFNETLGLETGLSYSRRNDLNIQRSFEGTEYSFGANRTEVQVTAKGADFIEIPFTLNYRFSPAHQLKVGYYAAHMFNISNEVQERTQGMYDDSWSVETRSASGYEEGFNTLDHGLLIGYEWALLQKFTLGLEYLYGLQDLSKDDIYIDTRKHYNRQLRFRFSYIIE